MRRINLRIKWSSCIWKRWIYAINWTICSWGYVVNPRVLKGSPLYNINDFSMKELFILPILSIFIAIYELVRCVRKEDISIKFLTMWVNTTALCMALVALVTLSLLGICCLMMNFQVLLITLRNRCGCSIFELSSRADTERGMYTLILGLFMFGLLLLIEGY